MGLRRAAGARGGIEPSVERGGIERGGIEHADIGRRRGERCNAGDAREARLAGHTERTWERRPLDSDTFRTAAIDEAYRVLVDP